MTPDDKLSRRYTTEESVPIQRFSGKERMLYLQDVLDQEVLGEMSGFLSQLGTGLDAQVCIEIGRTKTLGDDCTCFSFLLHTKNEYIGELRIIQDKKGISSAGYIGSHPLGSIHTNVMASRNKSGGYDRQDKYDSIFFPGTMKK